MCGDEMCVRGVCLCVGVCIMHVGHGKSHHCPNNAVWVGVDADIKHSGHSKDDAVYMLSTLVGPLLMSMHTYTMQKKISTTLRTSHGTM